MNTKRKIGSAEATRAKPAGVWTLRFYVAGQASKSRAAPRAQERG